MLQGWPSWKKGDRQCGWARLAGADGKFHEEVTRVERRLEVRSCEVEWVRKAGDVEETA